MSTLSFHYTFTTGSRRDHHTLRSTTPSLLTIVTAALRDGAHAMEFPSHPGILEFIKRGDTFHNVVWIDEAGLATRLEPKAAIPPAHLPANSVPVHQGIYFGKPECRGAFICFEGA